MENQKDKSGAGKITKDMTIGDIVAQYPEVIETLMGFGVHCVGCHVAGFESLEQGLLGHGMAPEEIDEVVNKLNNVIERAKQDLPSSDTVEITDTAVKKIKELLQKEHKDDDQHGLRIKVLPGGCSGLTYDFSFDKNYNKEEDKLIEKDGLRVFIDNNSLEHIGGSTIDYVDGLHGSGFKVENPKAQNTCGCGSSFA